MTSQTVLSDPYLTSVTDLLDRYFELFPHEREELSILCGQLSDRDELLCSRKNMRGHLTASGLLVHPNEDSVFLIYHNFLQTWLQPGGHLDPEEQPVDGAKREFVEETGLRKVSLNEWHATHPIPIDVDTHFIPLNEKKAEGEHHHHDFQYLLKLDEGAFETLNKSIDIDREEVSHFRWVGFDELLNGSFDGRLQRVIGKIRSKNLSIR